MYKLSHKAMEMLKIKEKFGNEQSGCDASVITGNEV